MRNFQVGDKVLIPGMRATKRRAVIEAINDRGVHVFITGVHPTIAARMNAKLHITFPDVTGFELQKPHTFTYPVCNGTGVAD